jgi:hypothetical protein
VTVSRDYKNSGTEKRNRKQRTDCAHFHAAKHTQRAKGGQTSYVFRWLMGGAGPDLSRLPVKLISVPARNCEANTKCQSNEEIQALDALTRKLRFACAG